MKKILLSLAAATVTLAASAYTLETPVFWEENFQNMGDYPTDGWITLGNGAKPVGVAADVYNPNGDGPHYIIFDYGSVSVPMANTDFVGGAQADEWLISPEIEVPYNVSSLLFNAYAYCPSSLGAMDPVKKHDFKVLVSEGGTDRSDFTEIMSNSVTSKLGANFDSAEKVCSINGYQGKKIRIAFVTVGSMQGFTGFSNLRWGQYALYVEDNLSAELGEVGKPLVIDYNMKVKAPTTCPSLKAELYVNDQKVKEETFKRAFGSATSYVPIIVRPDFSDAYIPETNEAITYKIVFTPEFEGAVPSVLEGGMGFPKTMYKSNVVIEELTGVACGFCPIGAAALEYFADTYPGTETQGKAISIAVHNSNLGTDPMAPGNERYTTSLFEVTGSTNLPGAVMNRATRGAMPCDAKAFSKLIAEESHNTAKILSVGMPEGKDGYELEGKKATVEFEVRNGYDASFRSLNAAIVLIENDVKGTNREYNQLNNLGKMYNNGAEVASQYAQVGAIPAMAPYFTPYTGSGDLKSESIPFSKMVYQHVSRGIFPSFTGSPLTSVWEADVPQTITMDFEIPNTVLDIKNTEVIVLVFNNEDRTIVASDIFPASKYTEVDAVESIETDSNINISRNGNSIVVDAAEGGLVEVYALDGTKLAEYAVRGGHLEAPVSYEGVVIVKVVSDNAVKSAKLIF